FCVLRAKARGHRDIVTVVGHAATITAGEWITASGDWVNDRTHGQQFRARFLRTSPPTSADGIEKYLSSGMIRGIGPAYSKNAVRVEMSPTAAGREGERTCTVFLEQPHQFVLNDDPGPSGHHRARHAFVNSYGGTELAKGNRISKPGNRSTTDRNREVMVGMPTHPLLPNSLS